MSQFTRSGVITKIQDHTVAGTSAVTSDTVDMDGFLGVVFVTSLGTAAADNSVKIQTSSNNSDWNDLLGTSLVSTADEDLQVDIFRPLEQYLRLVATRTSSSTLESIYAIQYDPKVEAVTSVVSGTSAIERHVSPIEGTA